MSYYPAATGNYTLNGSISSTQTSITLSSFTDPTTGVAITMSTLNTSIAYGTIGPKTSSAELISFTGITQNADGTATLTGVTRGLARQYPFTSSSSYKLPHSGQSPFILSDAPQVFQEFASIVNDVTIAGLWTFQQTPVGLNPGAVQDASPTVKGIVLLSTPAANSTTPIVVGTNDPRVPTQGENDALVGDNTEIVVGSGNTYVTQTGLQKNAEKFAVDIGTSTSYKVTLSPAPISYSTGMMVYAKMVNANTTTTPTMNVNSLGAKTIVKTNGSALAVGDIGANMFCSFLFDGTNFVLQNPVATVVNVAYSTGLGTWTSATVDGAGHQVATDGFLVLSASGNTMGLMTVKSDASSTPTTVRAQMNAASSGAYVFIMCPVRKNDYYSVTVTGSPSSTTYLFIPIS